MSELENLSGGPGGKLASGQSEEVVRGPIAPDDLALIRRLALEAQKLDAIGRLSSGMAHDFNNLLTLIIGTADLRLSMLGPADPVRRDLEEIRAAGERAAALTKQLLRFTGSGDADPRSINSEEHVREIEHALGRVIGNDVQLTTRLEAKLPWVRMDPAHFDIVLMNLASHARDSMPAGGKLSIECSNVAGPGGPWLELRVQDTGAGLTEAEVRGIFEPSFAARTRGRGPGLALVACHGIVTEAGGSLRVESSPGEGSTFRVLLPVAERGQREASLRESTAKPTCGTEMVMVVEEDPGVRRLCAEALEREGYRVVCAKDANDAIALSRHAGRVQLLITDSFMPGMNGRALYERLRFEQPGLRVLYTCGYNDRALGRSSRHEQEDEDVLLRKPFSPRKLARRVRASLDGC